MLKKDYYRPLELQSIFSFSFEDYLYLSAKYKNPIHFYSHYRRYLIVDDLGWTGEVHGVASYRGLVRLNSKDRIILLRNEAINIRQCYLDSKDGIHHFDQIDSLAENVQLPGSWVPGKDTIDVLPDSSVRACILPSKYISKSSSNVKFRSEVEAAYECRHSNDVDAFAWEVQLSDIVIPYEEAIWAKVMLFGGSFADYEDGNDGQGKTDRQASAPENYLHLTLKKLMKLYPTKAGSGMWSLIREGIENENDDIDPYAIFIEVGRDELIWKNISGLEQKITRDSFKNLVTRLRKEN